MKTLSVTESVRSDGLRWIEAENVSDFAAAEVVAQAGAGALLLAVGIAELLLGLWAAGWWQRSAAAFLASVGVAALARAITPLFERVRESSARPTERARESAVGLIRTHDGVPAC